MKCDRFSASTVSTEYDMPRIPTKLNYTNQMGRVIMALGLIYLQYMLLDPFKSFTLIEQSNVGVAIRQYFFTSKESVGSYSVVEGYNDKVHVCSSNEAGTVQIGVRVGIEAPALYKEENGQPRRRCCTRRRIDIKE